MVNLKKLAAEKAVDFVKDGMVVGLGTGSTVLYALKKLAKLIQNKELNIIGIPTSRKTEKIAKKLKIPLSTLNKYPEIDITIDGADEIDTKLNLIKGHGGALLREKIVASCSRKEVIVADESKLVRCLGEKFALPVEICKFGYSAIAKKINSKFGCKVELRKVGNRILVTDNGNYILDCKFNKITNPKKLDYELNNVAGVVENGLFVEIVDSAIIGTSKGLKLLS
ncbi:MAG: ribose 5-phosphate isomerase A [Candidatus Thermoplasmatota archaeon]|nr:ribose 5-phosphate isomerase A [Candidatus Thermoplasmatota archaeon]